MMQEEAGVRKRAERREEERAILEKNEETKESFTLCVDVHIYLVSSCPRLHEHLAETSTWRF
jgi:hypothetical protein